MDYTFYKITYYYWPHICKSEVIVIVFVDCVAVGVHQERLMEASRQQFACANPERSEKTQRRMRDIMMEEDGKLDFERHKSHSLPQSVLVSSTPSPTDCPGQ